MIRTFLLYLKLTVATCFKNRMRIFLTIAGVSIGLVIFTLGNSAIEGYLSKLYQSADAFSDNTYIISGNKNDVLWFVNKLDNEPSTSKEQFKIIELYESQIQYYQNRRLINHIRAIGTGSSIDSRPVPSFVDSSEILVGTSNLIYGRDFTSEDINEKRPVCIIERSMAMLLFQTDNAINKKLHLLSENEYLDLEIIGVVNDNYSTKLRCFQFNKTLKDESQNIIRYKSDIYIPISLINEIENKNENNELIQNLVIISSKNVNDVNLKTQISNLRSEAVRLSKAVKVQSKEFLIRNIMETQREFSIIKIILSICIFLISGFIILTIFLFAIKERIYEIGVRRALGASSFSILSQFIIEGIILSFISACISICISIFLSNYITFFIRDINFIDFTMIIKMEQFLATFALAILQGIVFSFFPAIIAAKIHPTEAIRWD